MNTLYEKDMNVYEPYIFYLKKFLTNFVSQFLREPKIINSNIKKLYMEEIF